MADETNKTEQDQSLGIESTKHPLFYSGWRPLLGYICVIGFGLQFIVQPILQWSLIMTHRAGLLPIMDTGALTSMLTGMLGLGVLRTVEKLKDAQGNH